MHIVPHNYGGKRCFTRNIAVDNMMESQSIAMQNLSTLLYNVITLDCVSLALSTHT